MCAEIDIIEHCLIIINTLELYSIMMNALNGEIMRGWKEVCSVTCLYGFPSSLS